MYDMMSSNTKYDMISYEPIINLGFICMERNGGKRFGGMKILLFGYQKERKRI